MPLTDLQITGVAGDMQPKSDLVHLTEPANGAESLAEAWHTPGPWAWRNTTTDRGMCLEIGGLTIEGIDHCAVSCHQADQRLMVAAPDMLEALKDILAASSSNYIRRTAREAIAKAMGA